MRKFDVDLYVRFDGFRVEHLKGLPLKDIIDMSREKIGPYPQTEAAVEMVEGVVYQWLKSKVRREPTARIGVSGSDPDFACDIIRVK
jgi:hypothetical protein